MIHVIATIDLAPGTRDAFLSEFHKNVPAVLAEQGCLGYSPSIDADTGWPAQHLVGPDRVVVVEQWADADALKAHGAAPHMKAYRAAVKAYVLGMELRILQPVQAASAA